AEPAFDGLEHQLLELIDDLLRIAARVLVSLVGEVDLPVDMLADPGRLTRLAQLDAEIAPRQERLDALETGDRPRQGKVGERMVDAAPIGARIDQAGSEQGLDL